MAQVGDNEAWHAVIETNLNSLFHVTKQVIDGTVERGWGRTINISSVNLDYNILFRWFLDMSLQEPSLDASTFNKNRERLACEEVALKFFDAVVREARRLDLLSDEHFFSRRLATSDLRVMSPSYDVLHQAQAWRFIGANCV